ncbi:hypothetical protein OPV22_013354 [Ensete ventricosum]|uniref:Uncharacterized protein n=1 Tax=Ensete ventricosum TaxID=4639 RepID=A0AAV8PIH8_ENSVE|nr:hypothetical protein OPV22_013354 [Ensete ventricosum]
MLLELLQGWRGFRRSGTSLRHGIGKMVLLKTAQHFRMTAHRCARLSIMEEEAIGLDVDALLYGQAARSCARSRATSSPSLSLSSSSHLALLLESWKALTNMVLDDDKFFGEMYSCHRPFLIVSLLGSFPGSIESQQRKKKIKEGNKHLQRHPASQGGREERELEGDVIEETASRTAVLATHSSQFLLFQLGHELALISAILIGWLHAMCRGHHSTSPTLSSSFKGVT